MVERGLDQNKGFLPVLYSKVFDSVTSLLEWEFWNLTMILAFNCNKP